MGMGGKHKKLQDFFVDGKIARGERKSIPILTSEDKILWVVGLRTDERFQVLPETKRVLRVEIQPSSPQKEDADS